MKKSIKMSSIVFAVAMIAIGSASIAHAEERITVVALSLIYGVSKGLGTADARGDQRTNRYRRHSPSSQVDVATN